MAADSSAVRTRVLAIYLEPRAGYQAFADVALDPLQIEIRSIGIKDRGARIFVEMPSFRFRDESGVRFKDPVVMLPDLIWDRLCAAVRTAYLESRDA